MMRKALYASVAMAMAFSPSFARAADINAAGAQQILDKLTYYLPKSVTDTGFLKVAPETQRYMVSADFTALMKDVDPKTFVIEGLKPFVYSLTPQDDGLWKVEGSQTLDVSGSAMTNGKPEAFAYKVDKLNSVGVFDPAQTLFVSGSQSFENGKYSFQSGPTLVTAALQGGSQDMRTENVQGGVADFVGNMSMRGLTETISSAGEGGAVNISVGSMDGRVQADKARFGPARDLLVFALELIKIKQDKLTPEQDKRLKQLLKANIPAVDSFSQDIHFRDVKVVSSGYQGSVSDLDYKLDFSGIKPDSHFGIDVTVNDPVLPPGLLPLGAEAATPKSASFGMSMKDLNLEGMLTYLADNADFTKSKPLTPMQTAELEKIILPGGKMHFEFSNVTAKSDVYDLSMSGDMKVDSNNSDKPEVNANITARDLDKTLKFLQENAGAVPQFGQAAFMVMLMKGFGKEQPDGSMLWNVKLDAKGDVTINGQQMKM